MFVILVCWRKINATEHKNSASITNSPLCWAKALVGWFATFLTGQVAEKFDKIASVVDCGIICGKKQILSVVPINLNLLRSSSDHTLITSKGKVLQFPILRNIWWYSSTLYRIFGLMCKGPSLQMVQEDSSEEGIFFLTKGRRDYDCI